MIAPSSDNGTSSSASSGSSSGPPALFLRPKEAAARLGFSLRQLRRLNIKRYPMPSRGTGKKPRVLYKAADLDRFAEDLTNERSRRPLLTAEVRAQKAAK